MMNFTPTDSIKLNRRGFLKAGGALVIGFNICPTALAQSGITNSGNLVAGPPNPELIDTWLAIHADNTATVYIGFAELGQGCSTSLLQVAAEELDLTLEQIKTVGLDTHLTPNQGGTYSSSAIRNGGPQIQKAAAEARLALLKMASEQLGASIDQLSVENGIVSVIDNPNRSISYGKLVGGKPFSLPFTGTAPVKSSSDYKIVSKSAMRKDIPLKVKGSYVYMQHLRLANMLHGRIVRPRGQGAYKDGAKILAVDESSIRDIPGVRVVRKDNFLAVLAEKEWNAIRGAQQLDVTWEQPNSLPGNDDLHEQLENSKTNDRIAVDRGDLKQATKTAEHIVSIDGYGPYQAHAPFGPNCALANVKADSALIMCSTQDVYATRRTLAPILGLTEQQIRVQYHEGSGTYGHSCYDDAAQAAAISSQIAGQPVRIQFMRWDEHGWDTYGPAHVGKAKVTADVNGKITSYEYHGWQHHWSLIETSAQLALGTPAQEWPPFPAQQVNPLTCGGMYDIANMKLVNHHVPGLDYPKVAWLRSPMDLSFAFVSEQAIDELAFRLKLDPYEFRRQNMSEYHWLGVLDAATKAANWQPRPAATNLSNADTVSGRGIGLGTHLASYGGAVAEIEVTKSTGKVRIKHLYGALDAGLVVNPGIVENQITGQLVQTASRLLLEEIKFDKNNVTSLDWNSYPILRFEDCPETTPVLVQRLDEAPSGAGEEVMAATAAAIANAFFDATGVRMKEYPFTPKRVLAALNEG